MGYSKVQSAVSGAVQVAGAITASTLTTICVFVPIVFVDSMTKDIFLDLALDGGVLPDSKSSDSTDTRTGHGQRHACQRNQ